MGTKITLATTLLFLSFFVSAQSYDTALGMRLGTDWGITLQQRVAKNTTIEVIAQTSFSRSDAVLNVLVEQHASILSRRLNIYTGAGLHGGWLEKTDDSDLKNPFGLSGIVGLEFTPGRVSFSYDFKPTLNLIGGHKTFQFQTGLSIRYIIVKRKWQPIKKFKAKIDKKRKKKGKKKINWRFWEKKNN